MFRFGTTTIVERRILALVLTLEKRCAKMTEADTDTEKDAWVMDFGRFCGIINPPITAHVLDGYVTVLSRVCEAAQACEQLETGRDQEERRNGRERREHG